MYFIEAECGSESVDTLESYRDILIPMMRERCPGHRHGSIGCKALHHFLLLTMVVLMFAWVWAVGITVAWYRLRKQNQHVSQKEKKKTYPGKSMHLELRPLTNGKTENV